MTILIENETDIKFLFDSEKLIKDVVIKTLEFESFPYEAEVNILITDDENIRKTNMEFREIDKETDVLSFPSVDFTSPSDFSVIEEHPIYYINPENDEVILGDILISAQRVKEQAKEYGHSETREFGFLIVHSMLHLLGYDHIDEEERKIMERKQEEILFSLGIMREDFENEAN